MEISGQLVGCSLHVSAAHDAGSISADGGAVHFSNGSIKTLAPGSVSVRLTDKARRVRVYVTGVLPNQRIDGPGSLWLATPDHPYVLRIDDDQQAQRGVYPTGLVVLGHVDLPAITAPSPDAPLSSRERGNLLRVIRALDSMAKLPSRGAAPSIEKQLQELGFTSPKESTIRGIIDEARRLNPEA